jgi:hypothetical protein
VPVPVIRFGAVFMATLGRLKRICQILQ